MIYLPGSRRNRNEEPPDPTSAGLSSGRFTEVQLLLLAEIAEWWSYRRAQNDSSTPLASFFGGLDMKGTARTTGTTPATATLDGITRISPNTVGAGSTYLVQALGVPDPPVVGEVYSLLAIAHVYCTAADTYLAKETQIARTPAATTSTEIRVVVDGGTDEPNFQVVGVSGITIDWTLNVYRLEL